MDTRHTLNLEAPSSLLEARLHAHYAAQLVSALAATFLDPAADDSHPNLGWSPELNALLGRSVPLAGGVRAALRLAELHVLLLDSQQAVFFDLPLDGLSMEDGYRRLSAVVAERAEQADLEIRPSAYELPKHDLGRGGKFGGSSPAALASLGAWYGLANKLLEEIRIQNDGASEVRCWPHHFDLATLISLDGDRSIGVGFSPGDESYAEPYWYITPWPYPVVAGLPVLRGGHWHTEGFVAAILTASEFADLALAEGPEVVSRTFLADALSASRSAL